MDFGEDLQQRLLRETSRDFLAERFPATEARRLQHSGEHLPQALRDEIAAMGWMGCALPEASGGGDGSLIEATIVAEEMGRALLPGLFAETVAAAQLLHEAAAQSANQEIVSILASGKSMAAMAVAEGDWPLHPDRVALEARAQAGGYVLDGIKRPVAQADAAGWLLCAARTAAAPTAAAPTAAASAPAQRSAEGVSLFLVAANTPGITFQRIDGNGSGRPFVVRFERVQVPQTALIGPLHGGWPMLARAGWRGAVLTSAMMLGACERALDITLEHARTRNQFGQPIGSLQAIQHRCADMAIDIAVSRNLIYRAALTIAGGGEDAIQAAHTSAAKCWTGEAAESVLNSAVRIHGAMGLTDECDISLCYRHCLSLRYEFGTTERHAEALSPEAAG